MDLSRHPLTTGGRHRLFPQASCAKEVFALLVLVAFVRCITAFLIGWGYNIAHARLNIG